MALGLCLASCAEHDHDARIGGPSGPLAVGAFVGLTLDDACGHTSSGKGPPTNFCETEELESVESLSSANPQIVRVLPRDEWPAELSRDPRQVAVVQALAPGTSNMQIEGTFSDGSRRTANLELRVESIERVEVTPSCDRDAGLPLVAPPGIVLPVVPTLHHGDHALSGFLSDVLQGEGLACDAGCTVQLPATKGTVLLTSRLDPKLQAALVTYEANDVTGIELTDRVAPGTFYAPLASFTRVGRVRLKGGVPCRQVPFEIETRTPDVCTGPDAARVWSSATSQLLPAVALKTGTCGLTLRMPGATSKLAVKVDLPLRVVAQTTVEHTASVEQPCSVPDATACTSGFYSTLVCQESTWHNATSCPEGRVCEFVARGQSGCKRPEGCAVCVR